MDQKRIAVPWNKQCVYVEKPCSLMILGGEEKGKKKTVILFKSVQYIVDSQIFSFGKSYSYQPRNVILKSSSTTCPPS